MRSQTQAIDATPIRGEKGGAFPLAVLAAVLACALACLGIGASAAKAAPVATTAYVFQSSFGTESGSNEPYVNGIDLEGGSGNILVPDEIGLVHVFAPDPVLGGTPLTSFATVPHATAIAVDRETGAVYVHGSSEFGEFKRYLSDGAPVPTYTLDPGFAAPSGFPGALTVDPSTHQVINFRGGQAGALIERFDPSTGALVSNIHVPAAVFMSEAAIGLDGTIYAGGAFDPQILRFTPAGVRLPSFPLAAGLDSLTVDPVSGNLLAASAGRLISFTPAGQKVFDVPLQAADTNGIAVDPANGRFYSRTIGSASVDAYAAAPYAGVEAPTASAITPTGFHLSTEVDPGAGPPAGSTVHFEYSTDGQSWTPTADQPVAGPGSFEADVTGLAPNVTYQVRAVASNAQTTHTTDPTSVTTAPVPPAVVTGSASDVGETGAVLNGTIDPIGLQTTFYFEYGTTTAYGSRVPLGSAGSAGGGRTVKAYSRTIAGLAAGTTYHFRLVALSAGGVAAGGDRTFTTVSAGALLVRAFEQVTPADKQGIAIVPRLAMQAEPNGEGLSYTTKSGANSSPLLVRSVAVRGATDWSGKIDTDPPLTEGAGGLLLHPTLAVSDDFGHAFVAANRPLSPGSVFGGLNLYKVDLATGVYHLVGSSLSSEAFNALVGASTTGAYLGGSADFSRLVFSSPAPLLPGAANNAIYRWTEAGGLEVLSVQPNGEASTGMRADVSPEYQTISADGSRAYYTAVQGSEPGVYLREGTGAPKVVSHAPGEPATPLPAILLGVNEDGRYAFLTSTQKLTADAPGEEGDVYRYDAADGSVEYLGVQASVVFNARLLSGSLGIGADGDTLYFNAKGGNFSVWRDGVVDEVAPLALAFGEERMSRNGRYYVLQSGGAVRVYDAATNQLSCVSCLPDGTPAAAKLPENGGDLMVSNRHQRVIDDAGTVFFDTTARLVAADVNGSGDVYTWSDGAARLISPGNRPFDAALADVSDDGDDVFFTTAQKLVGRDDDEAIDVYDARVGGGLPAQSPPPSQECLRDDCKATPNAGPELPFGGSEALSGPGNVKPKLAKHGCGKGKGKKAKKVKGKSKCVKTKANPKSKSKSKSKKHRANKSGKGGNR